MYNQPKPVTNTEGEMGCRNCKNTNVFRQKIGRCRQCMLQLTLLSLLSWGSWFYFYLPTPKVVGSITLLFAATVFSSLLLAHWAVALVLWFKGEKREERQRQAR